MTSSDVAGKPAGRGLKIALMISLAVNVLIIGGVISAMLCAPHWKEHGHRSDGLIGFAETLPPERATAISKLITDKRAALKPLRQAESEARLEARSALMADPFDEARFRTALDNAAAADAAEKRARLSILADMAAALTQDERRQLHEWFEARRARRHRERGDDDEQEEAKPASSGVAPASAE